MRKEVIKHSCAIQIANKHSLLQRRLFNVFLANAYSELPYADTHFVDLNDVCDTLGYESRNIQHIKESLIGLMTTAVEWNILYKDHSEDWQASTLLADVRLTNGVFSYSYSPFLRKKLYNPEIYAKISLSLQNDFNSTHSLALYELLLDYYDHRKPISRTPYIELAKFRELMGLAPDAYKEFKILNRDIIKKSLEEINGVSDLEADVNFKKTGRSINKMQFTIKRNEKNASMSKALPPIRQEKTPFDLDIEDQDIFKRLVEKYGVNMEVAAHLLETYDADQIQENLTVVENAIHNGKVKRNLAGFAVKAIKKDYKPPKTTTKKQDEANEKRKIAEALQEAEKEKRRQKKEKEAKQLINKFLALPSEEKDLILSQYKKTLPAVIAKMFTRDAQNVTDEKYSLTFFNYIKKENIKF